MDFMPIKCDLTPLIQSVPNGVGKIFDLMFGKMVAKREAAKRLIEAQTERQSRLIIDGKAGVDTEGNFIDFEQIKRDNVQESIEFAVREALNRDDLPSIENVSKTFFNKWREYAQYIDEKELKEFWGRVLVEEVYSPNTINLRVLNTLSMMSSAEAKIFNEAIKYIIFDKFIAVDFIDKGRKDLIIETLYSMGAIADIPKNMLRLTNRLWRFKNGEFDYHLFYQQHNNFCIALHVSDSEKNDDKGLSLVLLELTAIGKALYNLALSVSKDLSISLAESISKDILNDIDDKAASKITSISVYKLDNQKVIDTLFSKTF